MLVTFLGYEHSYGDLSETEGIEMEMEVPPVIGQRIIFNGGNVYVVKYAPTLFINSQRWGWEGEDAPRETHVEAVHCIVEHDSYALEEIRHSPDPRENMSDEERERFDKRMHELIMSVRIDMEREEEHLRCPQCGRRIYITTWRQDSCTDRQSDHCHKSHKQYEIIRDMTRGC
jgi:hypothetical protein